MENIFITLACIALILTSIASLASSSFQSTDMIITSIKTLENQNREILQTNIIADNVTTYNSGNNLDIQIFNYGKASIHNFSLWDIIIKYQDGKVIWIPYSTGTPGWFINSITINGKPEIYGINIFDPGETLKLTVNLTPAVTKGTTNIALISTDKGIKTQIAFEYE